MIARMKRRDFITLLGGAASAWPLAARAQQPSVPMIGYIGSTSPGPYADRVAVFRQGLNETGFVEGRNVAIEFRWAENEFDRMPALIADLVRQQVAVIAMAGSTPGAVAAKVTTTTIPIVFSIAGDPVQLGLVASLSRPGGNLTGMTVWNAELVPKRLELLHELVPTTATVALLVNQTSAIVAETETKYAQAAADRLGLQLRGLSASTKSEIDTALATLAQREATALLVGADQIFLDHREHLIALAARYSIPAIYDRREYATAGGLMSYGTSILDVHRWLGVYVGRILKGEKPAELPVMLPSRAGPTTSS